MVKIVPYFIVISYSSYILLARKSVCLALYKYVVCLSILAGNSIIIIEYPPLIGSNVNKQL